jgi:hypothetical protein
MSQAGRFLDNSGGMGPIQTITGNTGGPVGPDGSGNINVVGGNNITVAGDAATNTETVSVTGTTNHAVQVGNASGSLTSIPVGTNGELLIGATGANPAFALLTSTGGTIAFTVGPNSLNLEASGEVALTFDGDTGTAAPSGGVIKILGDPNITTIASGNEIQITLNKSFVIGFTSVTTTPYVVLSTDNFLGVTTSALAITVELPNAPATGRIFIIKDSTGDSATNPITITTVGGSVDIDGGTSYTINTDYEAINVLFDGTGYEIY